MKLAFCLFKYFPYGGLQRDFLRFLEVAVNRGHQVRVYCYSWEGNKPVDAEIKVLPARGLSNHARTANFINQVRLSLEKKPADIVFGFNKMPGLDFYYAADSCYEARARTERSWLYRMSSRYHHYVRSEQAVFDKDSSTTIFLISDTEKEKFIEYYGTPESRMFMLPPGISKDRCAGEDAEVRRRNMREELGLDDHYNLLLFIGSGFVKKGLDRAIRAVAALPEPVSEKTLLLVIGQDKPGRFQGLARQLGVADRIVFTGGRNDIPELLLAGDVLVHPALDEAAGIVLLEATVAGLPVIVTDICGYAHHIRRAGSGRVLSSPFEQSVLNEQLHEALANPGLRQRWKQHALAYAGSEDLYSMHETGIDLIEKRGC